MKEKDKPIFYGEINEEAGVVMAFTKMHKELGFPYLMPSSARGFDIENILYKGQYVTVEFEYLSSSFISHGHTEKMEKEKRYVVICWEDDCNLISKVPELYEVIELRNRVKIEQPKEEDKNVEEPLYILLSYDKQAADGKSFQDWKFSNCYRCKAKFKDNYIPNGSKILFKEGEYLIGGFTVVRYEVITRPKTEVEWNLYKKLTDYPMSLYTETIEELKEGFVEGHIFYTDFFEIKGAKVKWQDYINKKDESKKQKFTRRKNLTKQEYYSIVGN